MARSRRSLDPQTVELLSLDLGYLGLFVGYAMADAVQDELAGGGHECVRFSHGFVIQHLIDAPRSIGELARRMGVTQQAASKSVVELERIGYVERRADSGDARVTQVALSARGNALVAATRKARARLVARLDEMCGPRDMAIARAVLAATLVELGGVEAVRARRVRPPR